MTTPAILKQIVDAIEVDAGAVTSGNENESGRWKRIAAAAEDIANATSSANSNPLGYMLRTAIAFDIIAGTNGSAYNHNEFGYLARIVNALETSLSINYSGSLEYQFLQAITAFTGVVAASSLLLEAGDDLLLETGDRLLLE